MQHAETFFDSYQALNDWALAKARLLIHIVMKHHTFLHLIENARFLNPRWTWCFKSEDYVGKISHIAHSVSMGVRSTKLSQKIVDKYALMLHLCFTRGTGMLELNILNSEF